MAVLRIAKPTSRRQDDIAIQLSGIVKNYRTPAGEVSALRGIDASLPRGALTVILGKSGAGKSTLANMIAGIDELTAGCVTVAGVRVHEMPENRRAAWRGRNLGVVHQSFELLPQLSLLDNVLLPMDLCGRYRPGESAKRALDLLRQVGVAEHALKPPTAISGGQQQRVAIARALANDPPIILADEPTSNLDSATAERILQLFEGLVRRGKTIVVLTHDRAILPYATLVLHLRDGLLEQDGPLES